MTETIAPEVVELLRDTTIEPWTQAQIESRLRIIAGRLMEVIEELREANPAWAEAKADALKAYHQARIVSYADHPDRRVDHHESFAQLDSADAAAAAFAAERRVRALNDEAHSLRQVQSSLQSLYKQTGIEVGTDRGSW